MQTRLGWSDARRPVVLFALLAAFGCEAGDGRRAAPAVRRAAIEASCPFSEVVAIERPAGGRATCSNRAVGGQGEWIGEAVLATADRVYCRYTFRGAIGPDRMALLKPFDAQEAQVDCPLVGASAFSLDESVWQPWQEDWFRQAGRAKELPGARSPVEVAVIDSAVSPYAEAAADRFGHGRAVGRVVNELACPDADPGRCGVRIENHLALPYVDTKTIDRVTGGYFGTRGDLAVALRDALDAWQKRSARLPTRLVLNLSLGWAPKLDDNLRFDGTDRSLPEQLVHELLERASCLGALTIAAAGNGVGADRGGALLPAAWETHRAPDPAACRKRGFVRSAQLPRDQTTYRPLVHAVGAVDHRDRPLHTTRAGSQPRLVAHGLKVVTKDAALPEHTLVLSGTSMAAAVVSGIAAALWGSEPALGPHDLMAFIHERGAKLDPGEPSGHARTELCLGPAPCADHPISRASLCGPLTKLIGGDPPCVSVGAHEGKGSAPPVVDAKQLESLEEDAPAERPTASAAEEGPTGTDQPWLRPQPSQGVCPSCWLDRGSWTLRGQLDTSQFGWLGISSADLWLRVNGWWSWVSPLPVLHTDWPFSRWAGDVSGAYNAGVVTRFYGAVGTFDTEEEPIYVY